MWRNIVDAEVNDVAPTELAVYREVEERQIPRPPRNLQSRPNGPDVLGLQRRLGSNEFALVPGLPLRCDGARLSICSHCLSPISVEKEEHAVSAEAASW